MFAASGHISTSSPVTFCTDGTHIPVLVELEDYTAKYLVVQVHAPKAPWISQCFNKERVEALCRSEGESANLACDSESHFYQLSAIKLELTRCLMLPTRPRKLYSLVKRLLISDLFGIVVPCPHSHCPHGHRNRSPPSSRNSCSHSRFNYSALFCRIILRNPALKRTRLASKRRDPMEAELSQRMRTT